MAIKRKFSPVRSDDKLEYAFTGDVITVTHKKVQEPTTTFDTEGNPTTVTPAPIITVDSFDFTGLPDGEADVSLIQTTLPVNPFVSAKRVNGVLELVLINYHGANASEAERFPQWEVIN